MKLKFRLIAALLALVLIVPTAVAVAVEEEYINVALFKPVKASGNAKDHGADLAVDNLNTNEYHTYWESGSSEKEAWIQLDLGVNYLIDRLELEPPGKSGAFGGFEVIASKTADFYEYDVLAKCENPFSGSLWQVDLEPSKTYRYVKLVKKTGGMKVGEFRILVKNSSISQGMFIGKTEVLELMPFSEDGSYIAFSDVVGTGYNEPVSFLSAFQIMRGYTNGKFMPEEKITRAEFVATVIRALGKKVTSAKGERFYGDVPADYWAADAINSATSMGLINGVGENQFAPEENVTGEQALKIICLALGYEPLCEYKGGYPEGYLSVATDLKLLNLIKSGAKQPITRGEVAWLIYEALHTDVLKQTVYSQTSPQAEIIKGENLLKLCHDAVSANGRVVATDRTSLTDSHGAVKDGYIKIDSILYRTGGQSADDFLGLNVKYYYRTDENEACDQVVYMIPYRDLEIITVESDDIVDYNPDSRKFTWYDENYDTEETTILQTADVIYNGKAISTYSEAELVPDSGTVVLYDLDGDDSAIELVKISSERIGVLKGVNVKEGEIYLEDSAEEISIDTDKDDYVFINSETNEKMSLSDLKAGDVLNIMESSNMLGAKVFMVYITRSFVRGTAEVITNREIVIKGTTYKKAYNLKDVSVGCKGFFYFDKNGKIAYFDGSSIDDAKYGYLINIDESQGIDEQIKAKIYTDEGIFDELLVTEDTLLDGAKIPSYSGLRINLSASGRLSGEIHQAIKYGVNSKGELLYIDTIQTGTGLYNDFTKDAEAYSRHIKQNVFDCDFSMDSEAVVFKVPDDMSREKDFSVLSSAFFIQGSAYEIEAYDGGEEKAMKLILLTSASANQFANDSDVYVVDEIEVGLDGGESTKIMKAYRKGVLVEYLPYDEGVFDELKKGDIIQVTLANEKYVVKARKLYYDSLKDLPESAAICPFKPEYSPTTVAENMMVNNFYIGYGRVDTNKDGFIRVNYDTTNVETANMPKRSGVGINSLASTIDIYVYDKALDRVYVGSAEDIKSADTVGKDDASMVFFCLGAVAAKTIVVFK